MNKEKLRERCYEMGNSQLPVDVFYNDIRDNKSTNFNKEEAYADLEKIVDYIAKLQNENQELQKVNEEFLQTQIKAVEVINKYKKAIEFLVKEFHFEVKELTTLNGESEYYLYWQDKFSSYGVPISKEKYELLKEVLNHIKELLEDERS